MNVLHIFKIKHIKGFVLLFTIAFMLSCDDTEEDNVRTYELVWSDEFDGATLDTSKWSYEIGDGSDSAAGKGWGNNELQYYTNNTDNVYIKDGVLNIAAVEETTFPGSDYTSGRIVTKNIFDQKFGRFEARIKLPWGKGLLPAFWMLGEDDALSWPDIGEIDIMENKGNEPSRILNTIHGPGYSGGGGVSRDFELEEDRVDTDFHIYGIVWDEDSISFYVDDYFVNTITPTDLPAGTEWVFNDREFYMILNLAVGGNLPGDPDATTIFPRTMEIDYVRVYK